MKLIVRAVALVVTLAFLAPSTVLADYITDATEALKTRTVYVAPGTEGTDSDTAGRLQDRLNKKDNIVLVMLPSSAETELGEDIAAIAATLSEALENERIIGLAVGNDVVGYAPTLPAGVAADQMRRAKSVSNDPITALSTFTQNIHIWESENPLPSPTPKPLPPDSTEEGGSSWFWWLFGVIVVVVFTGSIGSLIARSVLTQPNTQRTRFKAPDQVKDLLAKIAKVREKVNDEDLKKTLYQMCVDIEKYFARHSNDPKTDSSFFKQRLTEVNDVLSMYIEVQNNPRYFRDPRTELDRGKSSIIDFSKYVLESIQNGTFADLTPFKVNTNILAAQRYRSDR